MYGFTIWAYFRNVEYGISLHGRDNLIYLYDLKQNNVTEKDITESLAVMSSYSTNLLVGVCLGEDPPTLPVSAVGINSGGGGVTRSVRLLPVAFLSSVL